MMRTSLHVQIEDDSRAAGKPARGRCYHLRPEHGARGVQFLDFAERILPLFDASLLTGRGFAPRPFSNSRTAGGRCIGIQRRRALGFLPRRLAAQFSRRQSIARRAQSLAPVDHLPCRDTDLPEHHSSSLVVAGFDDQQPSERQDGTILYQRGEFPDHQGARQHESR